jgi:hypothetical protein
VAVLRSHHLPSSQMVGVPVPCAGGVAAGFVDAVMKGM